MRPTQNRKAQFTHDSKSGLRTLWTLPFATRCAVLCVVPPARCSVFSVNGALIYLQHQWTQIFFLWTMWMGPKNCEVLTRTNDHFGGNAVLPVPVAKVLELHGYETKIRNPDNWSNHRLRVHVTFLLDNELLLLCEVKDFLCISFQDTRWSNCFSTSCCTMPSRRVPSTWDGNCTPTSCFPVGIPSWRDSPRDSAKKWRH